MNITLQQIEDAYETFTNKYVSDSRNKLIDRTIVESAIQTLHTNEASFNEDVIKTSLGRKYKCCLKRMLPIVYKLYNQYAKYLPVQIATTSKSLNNIHINISLLSNTNIIYYSSLVNTFEDAYVFENSAMTVSRAIDDLEKIGALIMVDDYSVFGHKSNDDCSKTYVISGIILKYLLSNIYNISLSNISNISYSNNNILYSSLVNTFDLNKKDLAIYNKHLAIIQNCINNQRNLPTSATYFIKEGGFRPYAPICSEWQSLEKYCVNNNLTETEARAKDENIGIEWREDYLDKYFGKDNWIEWDRNASIYNTTLYYNKHVYRDNNASDMYEVFNGKPFANKKDRNDFKLLNMSLYFGDLRKLKSFYDTMIKALLLNERAKEDTKISNKEKKLIRDFINNKPRLVALLKFAGVFEHLNEDNYSAWNSVKEWYENTRNNMFSYIGKPLKKTIFMVEGAINLTMAEKIRNAGFDCIEVYDGFFTNCKDTDLLDNLYKEAIVEVIR